MGMDLNAPLLLIANIVCNYIHHVLTATAVA